MTTGESVGGAETSAEGVGAMVQLRVPQNGGTGGTGPTPEAGSSVLLNAGTSGRVSSDADNSDGDDDGEDGLQGNSGNEESKRSDDDGNGESEQHDDGDDDGGDDDGDRDDDGDKDGDGDGESDQNDASDSDEVESDPNGDSDDDDGEDDLNGDSDVDEESEGVDDSDGGEGESNQDDEEEVDTTSSLPSQRYSLRPRPQNPEVEARTSKKPRLVQEWPDGTKKHEIKAIVQRRGEESDRFYLVVWVKGVPTWEPELSLRLDGNGNLCDWVDTWKSKYEAQGITFEQFTKRDLNVSKLMTANDTKDCARHAVEMAMELLGRPSKSQLDGAWEQFQCDSEKRGWETANGLTFKGLIRYLAEYLPRVGLKIAMKSFHNNRFTGQGKGFMALVNLNIDDGVYLVKAYRGRVGHCFAMKLEDSMMWVREDGLDQGIANQDWMGDIAFVRKIELVE